MAASSTLNLRAPDPVKWEASSTYKAPPPALDVTGKAITYTGQLPPITDKDMGETKYDDPPYREYTIDPIVITRSGPNVDGYVIRFTRVSTKSFINRKTGEPLGRSSASNLLQSAQIQGKPQSNPEFDGAMKQAGGRTVNFTVDWYGKAKDTGEKVRGYANFPDDPDRPGQKKAILKAGDTYLDENGAPQTLRAEVLFANAQVRYFQDNNRK